MAEVVYLAAGEETPDEGDDMRWLRIEHSSDGSFFGTGASWEESGEWVGYGSLAEDDISLERALAAARAWAERYRVPKIWVEASEEP